MSSSLPIWVQYTQALSLPVLAIIAAAIAYRQYRTAHDKLRLDLFDRRLQVYAEGKKFIHKVIREGHPDIEDFGPLWRARDAANFLFGPEIETFLKTVNDTAASLNAANKKLEVVKGVERQTLVENETTLFKRFVLFDDQIAELFSRYMRFSKVQE